jgi:hypothetical protein
VRGRYKDGNEDIGYIPDLTQPLQKVGIFWCVAGNIVGDAVAIDNAEPYGEALQHGGHYEFWETLKAGNETERKLKSHAYDYYPRGRMVYFPKRKTVRLYIDCCIDNDNLTDVMRFFEHGELHIEIEKDQHYQCAECNRHYME